MNILALAGGLIASLEIEMSAQEKNEYGFRVDSKPAIICAMGKEWFESATNKMVDELLGLNNEGYASNLRKIVAEKTGWAIFGAGERQQREPKAGKVKGCLPFKIAMRIAKILDLDLEETGEPGWHEWLQVADLDPDFEGFSMVRLAGGEESEGGKAYRQWIDSNRANDAAKAAVAAKAAEDAAKAADPTYQLKHALKTERQRVAELTAERDALRVELDLAKRAAQSVRRGPVMGGELDHDMLRIMKQRFHPDKNNGSPELCTRVMQWLNAIAL
jgi:hypothetical protein